MDVEVRPMALTIDLSQLDPRKREHYLPPYERHAWAASGPGALTHDVCRKCGALGRPCPVVLAGPPWWAWGCLVYPGGLSVREVAEVEPKDTGRGFGSARRW